MLHNAGGSVQTTMVMLYRVVHEREMVDTSRLLLVMIMIRNMAWRSDRVEAER